MNDIETSNGSRSTDKGLARRDLIAGGAAASVLLAAADAAGQVPAPGAPGEPSPNANPLLAPDGIPPLKLSTDYSALRRERLNRLDDQMRAIYDAALAAPSIKGLGVEAMRRAVKRPQAAVLPKGVTAYNIEIPGPGGNIPTRVYIPDGIEGPLGVYLSTHGGGWVFGEGLEYIDATEGRTALNWGCAVVHPDYRIAPEHKFPAMIDDCCAALQYIAKNSSKMGFDSNRIGIGGGCAGANIATVVSLMARDAKQTMPAIQFLWSGSFDMRQNYRSYYEFAVGYGLLKEDDAFVKSAYLRTEEDRWDWHASPILAETLRGAPPALFWVGEWEILRDEGRLYANRMSEAGCTVHFIESPQQGHGFVYLHPDTKASREDLVKINSIMRSYIGPESVRR